MPDPSSAFDGASEVEEVTSRRGVAQLRRTWTCREPRASALVLHGIAEHSGRYEHVGAKLAEAGYSTRSFDHQGHGRSGGVRGFVESFDVFLDDVEDNLNQLREEGLPVVLLAHSMGGLIAFNYCISGRPSPDALLLSGPALGAATPRWQRIAAPIIGRIRPKTFIKSEFDGTLLSSDPDVGMRYQSDPLRLEGATAGLGWELFKAMENAHTHMDALSIPTMVIHGGEDRIVPPAFSEPIGTLPVATRQVLPGLAHEILNEASWERTLQSYINFSNGALGVST